MIIASDYSKFSCTYACCVYNISYMEKVITVTVNITNKKYITDDWSLEQSSQELALLIGTVKGDIVGQMCNATH